LAAYLARLIGGANGGGIDRHAGLQQRLVLIKLRNRRAKLTQSERWGFSCATTALAAKSQSNRNQNMLSWNGRG
jgi:hypothetical protein